MKEKPCERLEKGRITKGPFASTEESGNNGMFLILGPANRRLRLTMATGLGWDHVSVSVEGSLGKVIPTWEEMAWVKRLCWNEDEVVMELHPAKDQYVNLHKGCLHLWKPQNVPIPLPPLEFV